MIDRQTTPLLSAREVALRLGVTKQSVYVWAQTGRVRHYRIGARLFFDPADLEAAGLVRVIEPTSPVEAV